jgi:uncharacterized repeat protein (TIGR03847 family)
MARRIFTFDGPDRFVAGTVGEPGSRAFFLQARKGGDVVSVGLEKAQVAVLAQQLDALLDLLSDRGLAGIPAEMDPDRRDDGPLGEPLVEALRVGAMALTWDAEAGLVVIEAAAVPADGEATPSDTDDDDPDGPDLVRIRIDGHMARAFVDRAIRVVAAGRPPCPRCGEPLDAQGHICARPHTAYLN